MERGEILAVAKKRLKKALYVLAAKLRRACRSQKALLRAIEASEMGISLRAVREVVARETDTIRPSDRLWTARGLRGPARIR
jgi:hypothetical protein